MHAGIIIIIVICLGIKLTFYFLILRTLLYEYKEVSMVFFPTELYVFGVGREYAIPEILNEIFYFVCCNKKNTLLTKVNYNFSDMAKTPTSIHSRLRIRFSLYERICDTVCSELRNRNILVCKWQWSEKDWQFGPGSCLPSSLSNLRDIHRTVNVDYVNYNIQKPPNNSSSWSRNCHYIYWHIKYWMMNLQLN
jgi:hypothetical protein